MAKQEYSPKKLFCENKELRAGWAEIVRNPVTQRAIAATHAQLAYDGFHNPEGMRGVRAFIEDLLNLAEPDEPKRQLPAQKLESFGEAPAPTEDK